MDTDVINSVLSWVLSLFGTQAQHFIHAELGVSTWNQELGDRLWPEPSGLLYTHSAKSTEGWSVRVSEGRKSLHMSDCDPSEARRTCAVCLRAPHLHGFLGKVKGLNRGSPVFSF